MDLDWTSRRTEDVQGFIRVCWTGFIGKGDGRFEVVRWISGLGLGLNWRV